MILFSHPTGNANVRHAALGLQRAGLLGEFWTCVHYKESVLARILLPGKISAQLRRRSAPPELDGKIHTVPIKEAIRHLAAKTGFKNLTRHETGPFSVDAVYRSLDRRVSSRLRKRTFTGVYAYEDGALNTFQEASRRGVNRFYDLPIGYWRAAHQILLEEAEREPEWAVTLIGNQDSAEKNARKDAELSLAETIFVASTFTKKTLEAAPAFRGSVYVVPYGAPEGTESIDTRPARGPRLRVLFVGSLGQRKGLSYLFAAGKMLQGALDLTFIGTRPLEACAALDRELANVRWIKSCPHKQVLQEMATHDVLVFPSLFEGFGLVLLEAMRMGLPVITTANTAGPDLLEDGVEGFIVPIRSAEAIAEKLDVLYRSPERCREMGERARARARCFTWAQYESRLAQLISDTPMHGEKS